MNHHHSHIIGTDVDRAVGVLTSGGLVGLPTETVYGLAARSDVAEAVRRVFTVKGRPPGHPLIVHVGSIETARNLAAEWNVVADSLARAFWPGPLTLVVPRSPSVLDEVTGGLNTVAIRVPAHPLALELLRRVPYGVVAPSANLFGRVSPTSAAHVSADLGDAVDYVLDGGQCRIGLESTIVDCSQSTPQILRPGAITEAEITALIGRIGPTSGPSRAPGMLASHYAPQTSITIVDDEEQAAARNPTGAPVFDARPDPETFAHDLYELLRRCDDEGHSEIIVILPSDQGIGTAIRDRLTKAAAPRS